MDYFIMKIINKRGVREISLNYSWDIDFRDFISLTKKCTAISYSFFIVDATLASDNSSRFRNNILERICKLIMKIDDKIRDKKLQYDINSETAAVSALSSEKVDKYEYITGEEVLPIYQKEW